MRGIALAILLCAVMVFEAGVAGRGVGERPISAVMVGLALVCGVMIILGL